MKIAAIDPSSTGIGYACGTSPRDIQSARLFNRPGDHWNIRVKAAIPALRKQIQADRPDKFVIEEPSGHTHARVGNAGGWLAYYGCGVGAIWMLCELYAGMWGLGPNAIELINANDWTRHFRAPKKNKAMGDLFGGKSSDPKAMRRLHARQTYPRYVTFDDPKADLADAICLLDWWFTEQRVRSLK